ncbi:hypothetical protein PFTANZ_02916 [Plasmodium falciparum Tanzania (2000708)]|uniref:Uncharacterized protein n=2 Tax=Plasmodium falciparum TaxID=5833 RepID=A0A024W640_PLAFA|nr:hypothetical protein PFFVO_02859 [Plasmodium falciparum Vietnam Oak-Knoll (FVO)]ETW36364.1 hypothetical protein PFTANZ_02916 [Plasmodium falciparum Tanzania (2000708)]
MIYNVKKEKKKKRKKKKKGIKLNVNVYALSIFWFSLYIYLSIFIFHERKEKNNNKREMCIFAVEYVVNSILTRIIFSYLIELNETEELTKMGIIFTYG